MSDRFEVSFSHPEKKTLDCSDVNLKPTHQYSNWPLSSAATLCCRCCLRAIVIIFVHIFFSLFFVDISYMLFRNENIYDLHIRSQLTHFRRFAWYVLSVLMHFSNLSCIHLLEA